LKKGAGIKCLGKSGGLRCRPCLRRRAGSADEKIGVAQSSVDSWRGVFTNFAPFSVIVNDAVSAGNIRCERVLTSKYVPY